MIGDSSIHSAGCGRTPHCGLDPQSRGAGCGRHTGFKAASTGWGDNKTTPTIFPLSLDGRGIKGEGENDAPHRHVIADLIRNPEVRGGGPGPSYWLQGSIHRAGTSQPPAPVAWPVSHGCPCATRILHNLDSPYPPMSVLQFIFSMGPCRYRNDGRLRKGSLVWTTVRSRLCIYGRRIDSRRSSRCSLCS